MPEGGVWPWAAGRIQFRGENSGKAVAFRVGVWDVEFLDSWRLDGCGGAEASGLSPEKRETLLPAPASVDVAFVDPEVDGAGVVAGEVETALLVATGITAPLAISKLGGGSSGPFDWRIEISSCGSTSLLLPLGTAETLGALAFTSPGSMESAGSAVIGGIDPGGSACDTEGISNSSPDPCDGVALTAGSPDVIWSGSGVVAIPVSFTTPAGVAGFPSAGTEVSVSLGEGAVGMEAVATESAILPSGFSGRDGRVFGSGADVCGETASNAVGEDVLGGVFGLLSDGGATASGLPGRAAGWAFTVTCGITSGTAAASAGSVF